MIKKILSGLFFALVFAGCLFLLPGNAAASVEYRETYYALRGETFTLPDELAGAEVTDPSGDKVTVENGSFRVNVVGDYVITDSGVSSVLKVYKKAAEVIITVSEDLPASLKAGEVLYFPDATGESEIKNYDDFTVEVTFNGGKTVLSEKKKKYEFLLPGDYTASYVFTDVFGIQTKKEYVIEVISEAVIVLQNFPKTMVFGEEISLEETYGFYDGDMYECECEVTDKTGSRKLPGNVFAPASDGENVLVFSSSIKGKTVKRSVKIDVSYEIESLFVKSSIKSVKGGVSYSSGANVSKKGVLLKGNTGAKATYAKVLNLKELSDSKTKIIEFQSSGTAKYELTQARVTLTDAKDKNNTLSVYWWINPWNDHLSYMLVEYDDISVAISNESSSAGIVRNTYGTVAYHNFTNVYNKNCLPFNFRYDFEERAIYSDVSSFQKNYKVLDTDNEEELGNWKAFGGFKGEEVYLTLEFTVSSGGGAVVSEIGGEKLDKADESYFCNDKIIQLSRKSGLENAVKGYRYELPASLSEDVVFGEVSFTRKLEYNDGGVFREAGEGEGTVSGDYFTPLKSGEYRAVYEGYDNFGKPARKEYLFSVYEKPSDIEINANAITSLSVLDDFVLPEAVISGGTGKINVVYTVTYGGVSEQVLPGYRLTLSASGNVKVNIEAEDELGFKKEAYYEVTVDMNKTVFVTSGLPRAVEENTPFGVPSAVIRDYSEYGKSGFEQKASVLIDGQAASGEYTVRGGKSEIKVTFVSPDGNLTETHTVKVVPAEKADISDALLFDKTTEKEFYETGLTFSSAKDFGVEMPYAVPFYDLSFKITLFEDGMKFETAEAVLISERDSSQKITLSVSGVKSGKATLNVSGKTYTISVENGVYGELSSYNGRKYDALEFSFSINGKLRICGKEICVLSSFDSGRDFTGFDGGKAFLSFGLSGVTAKSSFAINYAANQNFNAYTMSADEIMPVAGFDGEIKSEYAKGENFVLPAICLGDVLSPVSSGTVTVKTPGGKTIKNAVDISEEIAFELSEYGYYKVEITAEDGMFNEGKKQYYVYVADKTAPTITVKNFKDKYSVGDKFVLPDVTVTDDYSTEDDDSNLLVYYLYLELPTGKIVRLSENGDFTFTEKGKYTFIVYSFDSSMNVGCECLSVTVG